MVVSRPKLLGFSPDSIPTHLRSLPRWAPWEAIWNEKRGKYDKVPKRAEDPGIGLSSAKPASWYPFDAAFRAYVRHPSSLAGIGYCMTGPHGVIGIDLDDCIEDGQPMPWAAEIIAQAKSYTELSPSGNGYRIMGLGDVLHDWNNHDVGIEVYGGNQPRFLTVTGAKLPSSPGELRRLESGFLEQLMQQYARTRPQAEIIDLNMPDVLDDLTLPDLDTLGVSHATSEFLTHGDFGDDRSRTLHRAGVDLFAAGCSEQVVFSLLANNSHAMEVALDHRRQDYDRALLYLWREHCVKAKGKGLAAVASVDEFDVVDEAEVQELEAAEESKPLRFQVQQAGAFSQGKPPGWIIKGVLPRAELVVLFGESGSGKTFLTLDLVGSIAQGTDWRGRRTKSGRVVYIAAEGGGGFRNRLTAYARHHELELGEVPFGVIHAAPNFLLKDDALEVAKAIVAGGGADIIVVDTFAQVTPGANENAAEDVGKAIAHCRGLHRATGAVVLLVHHAGKDSTKGARGWSGLRAAADAEIEVVRTPTGRMARVTKQKDGEDGLEFGFALETVEIGQDEDGDAVTSCIVVEAEVPVTGKVASKKLGPWERLVAEVVSEFAMAGTAGIEVDAVLKEVVKRGPPADPNGGRDTRKQRARRALLGMCEGDDAPYLLENDCIEVL